MDFKREVEEELTEVKNEFILSLLNIFVNASPIPGIAPYAKGPFINTTQLSIGSFVQSLDLFEWNPWEKKKKLPGDVNNARYSSSITQFVSDQPRFHISNPYDKISLTNYIPYNYKIEKHGWGPATPPYKTFKRTIRTGRESLEKICQKHNQKTL